MKEQEWVWLCVSGHGGTIFYESEYAKKTCFFLRIAKEIYSLRGIEWEEERMEKF